MASYTEQLCNCERLVKSDIVTALFIFFSPTEQLPYLGGFHQQGRKAAITAQVRAYVHTAL